MVQKLGRTLNFERARNGATKENEVLMRKVTIRDARTGMQRRWFKTKSIASLRDGVSAEFSAVISTESTDQLPKLWQASERDTTHTFQGSRSLERTGIKLRLSTCSVWSLLADRWGLQEGSTTAGAPVSAWSPTSSLAEIDVCVGYWMRAVSGSTARLHVKKWQVAASDKTSTSGGNLGKVPEGEWNHSPWRTYYLQGRRENPWQKVSQVPWKCVECNQAEF